MIPPKLATTNSKPAVLQWTDAHLSCVLEQGSPIPSIQWRFNNSLIERDNSCYDFNLSNTTLTIYNVTLRHVGTYYCIASNTAGTVNITVELLVQG